MSGYKCAMCADCQCYPRVFSTFPPRISSSHLRLIRRLQLRTPRSLCIVPLLSLHACLVPVRPLRRLVPRTLGLSPCLTSLGTIYDSAPWITGTVHMYLGLHAGPHIFSNHIMMSSHWQLMRLSPTQEGTPKLYKSTAVVDRTLITFQTGSLR